MKSKLLVFTLGTLLAAVTPTLALAGDKNPEDDVNQIGNRNVGKGLDWYSLEKEIALGKAMAQQVEAQSRIVTDPVVNEYVNRLAQNLVRNSDAKVPFTVKVVDSEEVNAFALPGGFFFVNTGLILAADNEAELAGVMAHEIAHVAARHGTRQATRGELANLATIPLIFVGGPIGYGVQNAAGLIVPMGFLKFSRSFEKEADYLGLQYMYKTGYDPQAFVDFFEKLQAQEKKRPGFMAKAFSTHPQTPDRIEASQKEIATILPARDESIVDTSEFHEVKTQLERVQNRVHKGKPDNSKPTLRRTSTAGTDTVDKPTAGTDTVDNKNGSNGDSPNSTDSGDQRPTLKRRD